jgi:hypothetical protein
MQGISPARDGIYGNFQFLPERIMGLMLRRKFNIG